MMLFVVVMLSLFALATSAKATAPSTFIPLSANSYSFTRGTPSNVVVDLYIDLGCSSTMDAWPVLTDVVKAYKDKVSFLFHVFPLPYHQQAFLLSKAAWTVQHFAGDDAAFVFFDTVFAKQPQIYNDATADKTYNEVIALIGTWATDGTNVTDSQYAVGMNKSNPVGQSVEMGARYMWKYSTLHDVFGTPLYFVNGVFVTEGLDTYDEWAQTLDSLVK